MFDWIGQILSIFGAARITEAINFIIIIGILFTLCYAIIKAVPAGWLGTWIKPRRRWSDKRAKKSEKIDAAKDMFMLKKAEMELCISNCCREARLATFCDRLIIWLYTNGECTIDGHISFSFQEPVYESIRENMPMLTTSRIKIRTSETPHVSTHVFGSKELLVIDDTGSVDPFDKRVFEKLGTKSLIIAPLKTRGHTIGFVTAAWLEEYHDITDHEIALTKEYQTYIGVKLEDLQLLCRKEG